MSIQILRSTKTIRESSDRVLLAGQPLIETDTNTFYVGNGTTEAKDLEPVNFNFILKELYPVGSIIFTTDETNPGTRTLWSGTTWVVWGSGKVPVGVDTSDTSFNISEKTGGEKTHQLTINEMPKHNHTGTENLGTYNPTGTGSFTDFTKYTITTSQPRTDGKTVQSYQRGTKPQALGSITQEYGVNNGNDAAHNNLQPYITCYMWKRVE